MRCPSAKKLKAAFRDLSTKDANLIRRIAKATDDGAALGAVVDKCCPATTRYVGSMHSDPYNSHMWRVTVALHAINEILGMHGVESLGPSGSTSAPPYEYLNAGDTYATTLIYRRKTDALSIGCWGDIAEKHPSW